MALLERRLSLWQASAINMIDMVGIGPFITLPMVIGMMNGPYFLYAWFAGAFLSIVDGMVWSELGAAFPRAGGSYNFLKDVFSLIKKGPFESSEVRYKRNLFDVGGGYFVSLNKRKTITFNFYGGFSWGRFSFVDDGKDSSGAGYHRYHNNGITRWFFQPSWNFMPGKYIRFSSATRFSAVHYVNP